MERSPESAEEPSSPDAVRQAVRRRYGAIAAGTEPCCGPAQPRTRADEPTPCCGQSAARDPRTAELADVEGPSLGSGDPVALASLAAGETVLDLGSGVGVDALRASREVGPIGRVIGVDMTPEMVETARRNAARHGAEHVEFRLGEIEHLPLADASVDVVISNCVINLAPEKDRVFAEAYRALRPGGRLAISDLVRPPQAPPTVHEAPAEIAACVAGSVTVPSLRAALERAGFTSIAIEGADGAGPSGDQTSGSPVFAADIIARKPADERICDRREPYGGA